MPWFYKSHGIFLLRTVRLGRNHRHGAVELALDGKQELVQPADVVVQLADDLLGEAQT